MAQRGEGKGGNARRVGVLGLLLLAGCASSPSVPLTGSSPARTVAGPNSPPPVRPTGSAPARTPPVEPTARVPVPPPVSAQIAALFPAPSATFATPAFAAGRQNFTSGAESSALLRSLAGSGRDLAGTRIERLDLGLSQQGRPLEAISFTRSAFAARASDAAGSEPARRAAILLVAGQHGDEPAGSEALLVLAQELAAGKLPGLLEHFDVILLPRANPDGAAAFQRELADGSDLNRDHLLLNSFEAQAQAQLLREFAPTVVVDLHEYPVGAFVDRFAVVPRFDALFQYATVANLPPFIHKAAEEWFRVPLLTALRSAGLSGEWYHTVSRVAGDQTLSMGGVGPNLERNASGLRNAISLLVESRGGGLGRVDFARRVQTQWIALQSILGSATLHAADLAKVRDFVERDVVAAACRGEVLIEAAPTPGDYSLTVIDPETAALRQLHVGWQSSLALRPLKSRPRPCGYWLEANATDAVRRLRLLGVDVAQLDEAGEMRVETYRETGRVAVGGAPDAEAATRLRVQTASTLLDVPAGSYYVGLDQPLAALAVAALEPESPAGFAANGVIAQVGAEARVLLRPKMRMSTVP